MTPQERPAARFRRLAYNYVRFLLFLTALLLALFYAMLKLDPNGRMAATLDHYLSPDAKPVDLR